MSDPRSVEEKAELHKLLADERLPEYRREGWSYRLGWCGASGRARILSEIRKALRESEALS